MASKIITNLLNNITLLDDPYEEDKIGCQEVVNYCEARFRVILQKLYVSQNDTKKWMIKVLYRELELCFSYIGVAAAIGRQIDIPVIVRSLGHDLYRVGYKFDNNFQPGLEFLTYLDGNLSGDGPDDPNLKITNFHLAWWNTSSAPQRYNEYLSFMTIQDALGLHRVELESISKRALGTDPGPAPFKLTKPAYSWHPEYKSPEGPDCSKCRLYRAVSHGVVTPLRDIRNMIQACEVGNKAEEAIGIRRASIFNELFQAALEKEGAPDRPTSVASKPGRGSLLSKKQKQKRREMIDMAHNRAVIDLAHQTEVIDLTVDAVWESQSGPDVLTGPSQASPELRSQSILPLDRLKMTIKDLVMDLIGASKKWTWGVDLTKADLKGMVRGIDRVDHAHSGYDSSLNSGSRFSTISQYMNPATIEEAHDEDLMFDQLSPDVASVRSLLPHEFPVAFNLPTLHYSACKTDSEPDSAIEAFTKKAVLRRGKRVLQEEVYLNSDIYSDESNSPIQSFHERLSQPSNIHVPGLAVAGSFTQSPLHCPVDIASDDSFNPEEEMNVDVSDERGAIDTIPIGNLGEFQDDDFVGPASVIPMVIVGSESEPESESESDSNNDFYTEELGAEFIVPQFDGESPSHIPTTVTMCDSDLGEDDDDDGRQQSGSVIPPGAAFGRDSVTGTYTAASFAHFQDEWA